MRAREPQGLPVSRLFSRAQECAALDAAVARARAGQGGSLIVTGGPGAGKSALLVCLIDDAHWLDPESAQVLAFVARRLQNERILMVFAARDRPGAGVFSGIPELGLPGTGHLPGGSDFRGLGLYRVVDGQVAEVRHDLISPPPVFAH